MGTGSSASISMDIDGNRELIYEGTHNIWHAMPVKPRRQPPEQPDRVRWPRKGRIVASRLPGYLYSADVCAGVPDLPRSALSTCVCFSRTTLRSLKVLKQLAGAVPVFPSSRKTA